MSSELEQAAFRWWKSHRPVHWSQDEHLRQPLVNVRGIEACVLAEAVAEALKKENEK